MYEPQQRDVFISSGSRDEGASYFQQMNLPQGQLKPSCCSADDLITISCPGTSTEAVSLLSPCKWTTNNVDITRSIGSVFAKTSHLSLPTSISGLRYRNVPDKRYNNDIRDTPGECKPCDTCEDEPVSDCNCYTHTQHDTQDFLNTRALAFTYIGEIQNLLPPWLQMFVNLELALESSPLTSYDFFAPITRPNDEVSSIEGCSKLTGLMNGIFSVLRYEKTLSAVIDGENFDYREDGDTGSSGDPMCFAVDLCHGSPVHIQMSQPINDILVSEYLDQFSSLQMHTVTLFNPMIPHSSTTQYWNGKEMVTPPEINIDISITTDAKLEFSDDSLQMSFDFSGSSMFDYKAKFGSHQGQITLVVISMINGAEQHFEIYSDGSKNAFSYINDGGNPCMIEDMAINGMSFAASYEPRPGEQFYTRLLRFKETTQNCEFEAFLPIESDYRALGLSLHTVCPLLALDELILPEMSHTFSFIGSRVPNCSVQDFLGVSDPALVIESELTSTRLLLGNILELQPNAGAPDISTVFGKTSVDFVSKLHSVQVTLFGEMFLSEATISNSQLVISASSRVFGYPAEYSISTPSDETDWQELLYSVQGSLLPGQGSFIETLSTLVTNKLMQLGESGNIRREIAQMSLDQSSERFNAIDNQYNNAVKDVREAEEVKKSADIAKTTAHDTLNEIEVEFNNSRDELQDLRELLDELCTEVVCEDVCMPGESCSDCTRPVFIEKTSSCPKIQKQIRSIRVPPFQVRVVVWRFSLACRIFNFFFCYGGLFCPVGRRSFCNGLCERRVEYDDVYNWIQVEEEVLRYEQCVLTVFDGLVPDTCCETVNCALFAPDASCIMNNAMCRELRQNAMSNVENLQDEQRELFERLVQARKELSLADTFVRKAQIDLTKFEQRRDQLETSRDRLQTAQENSVTVYEKTLEEIAPLLKIYDNGIDIGYQNIAEVTSVTFNTMIRNSPTALAFNVTFQKQIDGNREQYDEIYVYNSQHSEETLEQIADDIIELAFLGNSKRSTWIRARFGRQAMSDLSQRQIFDLRCAHVSNTLHFFTEIQNKLMEVQLSIEQSRESTTLLSQNFTNQTLPGDEEFSAYIDLIKSYEDLSMEALRALESTIFSEWQATMELLYSESGSVGEVGCDGLADCLQTAVDELQKLINLTPTNEINQELVSLLPSFSNATSNLLDLALVSNISIDEALGRVEPIIKITNAYATDTYWCNNPPVIITNLPPQVNVSLGGTLRLKCEADSNLTVRYEWRRNDNILPQFTTNQLVITTVQRQDSANYTCFANNPVGSIETITTSVRVYELPEFYLTPEPVVTYFGDENGAWFACNATAWPYPGWRWFYRATADEEWTTIEGEDTNELLILNPQQENEGVYVCEAFNYHGSIRSEPVTLTLVPFTISQHQYQIDFSILLANESCNLDDLFNTIYSLISDTIKDQSSIIDDFNYTQVDQENYEVSLHLVSENVTSPYLHVMTYEDIANLALAPTISLQRSLELIKDLIREEGFGSRICPEHNVSVEEGSVVISKLRYLCPPGQQLNSDYLLCLSCEKGQFTTERELNRIANGVGLSENVPVCEVCPLDTYADELGSSVCTACPKYHKTTSTGANSIEECLPQPLVLECEATTTSDHVNIDCKTNRPPLNTLCTFNDGLPHSCSYPVAINRDVSPLGSHSLTISVEDDEGFHAQATVPYFLEADSKPTVPAIVPPLVVSFINDSPRVQGNSVEADILLSRPVQSLVCRLKGGSTQKEEDCSSGHIVFSSLRPAIYTLRVVATNRHPDKEFIKSRFEITNDTQRCTLHLINGGVSISNDSATVEFTGRGPATGYRCHLDKITPYECSNPVVLSGLSHGTHQLKVMPTGCGSNRKNLKTEINIE